MLTIICLTVFYLCWAWSLCCFSGKKSRHFKYPVVFAGLLTHMEHMRMDPKHQFAAQYVLSRAAAERRERESILAAVTSASGSGLLALTGMGPGWYSFPCQLLQLSNDFKFVLFCFCLLYQAQLSIQIIQIKWTSDKYRKPKRNSFWLLIKSKKNPIIEAIVQRKRKREHLCHPGTS